MFIIYKCTNLYFIELFKSHYFPVIKASFLATLSKAAESKGIAQTKGFWSVFWGNRRRWEFVTKGRVRFESQYLESYFCSAPSPYNSNRRELWKSNTVDGSYVFLGGLFMWLVRLLNAIFGNHGKQWRHYFRQDFYCTHFPSVPPFPNCSTCLYACVVEQTLPGRQLCRIQITAWMVSVPGWSGQLFNLGKTNFRF